MPSPAITVEFDYAKIELLHEGYRNFRPAAAMRKAILVDGKWKPSESGLDEPTPGTFRSDSGLWQDPESGVIMLRPSTLRSDWAESVDFLTHQFRVADMEFVATELENIPEDGLLSQPESFAVLRPQPETTELVGITAPTDYSGLNLSTEHDMIWHSKTKTALHVNEAFSYWCTPSGVDIDRADENMCVAFGGRFALFHEGNGQISCWLKNPSWRKLRSFDGSQGGVDQTQPYMVTVLFWGFDTLSILLTQQQMGERDGQQVFTGRTGSQNIYLHQYGFQAADLTGSMGQWAIADAAPIAFGVRKKEWYAKYSLCRVRYALSGCGCAIVAEELDEPQPQDPEITYLGFSDKRINMADGRSRIQKSKTDATDGISFVDNDNTAWVKTTDTRLVAKFWMKPSQGYVGDSLSAGLYTPEMWGLDYVIPPTTHTPTGAGAFTVSDRWSKLRFVLSNHPDDNDVQILWHPSASQYWQNMYAMNSNFRIKFGSTQLVWGRVERFRPVMRVAQEWNENVTPDRFVSINAITDDTLCVDAWHDLNTTPIGKFTYENGRSVGWLIEKALFVAGKPLAAMDISAELYTVYVSLFDIPGDFSFPSEDMSVGDYLRDLIRRFGYQSKYGVRELRILPRQGIWKAYLTPAHDPTTAPSLIFYLNPDALLSTYANDAARWADNKFKILENPDSKGNSIEFDIVAARYNAFHAFASITTNGDGDMRAAHIAPRPASLVGGVGEPDYRGRVFSKYYGPNEVPKCASNHDLHRFLRKREYEEGNVQIPAKFFAEWQKEIEPDLMCMVVGLALIDDAGGSARFVKGDPISYGAFRIEEIGVEVDQDNPKAGSELLGSTVDRKFQNRGHYVLTYVGETTHADYPMFTELTPIYGRAP